LLLEVRALRVLRGVHCLFRLGGAAIMMLASGALASDQIPAPVDAGQRPALASLPGGTSPYALELPAVLSTEDEARYRDIFALQERGKWRQADALIAQLQDDRLMGHVLEQRYMHPTAYRSKYVELKRWMDAYADHPGADRVYKLAVKRRPANYKRPKKPRIEKLTSIAPKSYTYDSPRQRSRKERLRVHRIKQQIRRNVLRTRLTATERLLRGPEIQRLFDQVEIDEGFARVAAGWFYYGETERAFALAGPAADRSGAHIPEAHWMAGLAAWRLNRLEDAARHFEALAEAERVSDWLIAAGGYWAARANLKLRRPAEVSRQLRLAAAQHYTFYGLLAGAALGLDPRLDFTSQPLDAQLLARLESHPKGRRALGLLQVGQHRRAERELLQFGNPDDPRDIDALIVVAEQAGLPNLAFKLGNRILHGRDDVSNGPAPAAALYPIPPWQPAGGFALDRALIFGLMRQESAFNPKAKSRDGARGLMQLMPRTASFVEPGKSYHRGGRRDKLYDPALNIDLGQRYITYLLAHKIVDGDLFRMAAAYNGGPGNLAKWQNHVGADTDPLLFIESLPSRETRLFIERVLANFWIYRQRLGQETPSLDQVATGTWPHYHSLDVARPEVAENDAN
jgi:soluble lytic murein transglycosylase-like protein